MYNYRVTNQQIHILLWIYLRFEFGNRKKANMMKREVLSAWKCQQHHTDNFNCIFIKFKYKPLFIVSRQHYNQLEMKIQKTNREIKPNKLHIIPNTYKKQPSIHIYSRSISIGDHKFTNLVARRLQIHCCQLTNTRKKNKQISKHINFQNENKWNVFLNVILFFLIFYKKIYETYNDN